MSGYWRSSTQSSYVLATVSLHYDSTVPSEQFRYSVIVIPSKARIADARDITKVEGDKTQIDLGKMEEGIFYRFNACGEIFLARRHGGKVVVYKVFEDGSLSVVPLYELEAEEP